MALVSKDGNKHTYINKRWFDTHTCIRVLNKISINSMWIAKTVATRLSSSGGVIIRDIVFEIISNFSVGITMSGAWKDFCVCKSYGRR